MSVQKGRPEIQSRRVSAVALQRHNLPTADFSVRDHGPAQPGFPDVAEMSRGKIGRIPRIHHPGP